MIYIETFRPLDSPSIWFKRGKATTSPEPPYGSTGRVKTIRKARRIARGIIDRWPDTEVHIYRYKWRNGQRYIKGEIWNKHPRNLHLG